MKKKLMPICKIVQIGKAGELDTPLCTCDFKPICTCDFKPSCLCDDKCTYDFTCDRVTYCSRVSSCLCDDKPLCSCDFFIKPICSCDDKCGIHTICRFEAPMKRALPTGCEIHALSADRVVTRKISRVSPAKSEHYTIEINLATGEKKRIDDPEDDQCH